MTPACRYYALVTQVIQVIYSSYYLENDSGFLQEVGPHVCSDDPVLLVEADLGVLPKTAAVVIPGGLCISYCLRETAPRHTHLSHQLSFSSLLMSDLGV